MTNDLNPAGVVAAKLVLWNQQEYAYAANAENHAAFERQASEIIRAYLASLPQPEGETAELVERLRIKAAMLRMGEPIAFGSDADAIETAADAITSLSQRLAGVEAERDAARKQAGDYERLHAEAYELASEEMDRAEAAEARIKELESK